VRLSLETRSLSSTGVSDLLLADGDVVLGRNKYDIDLQRGQGVTDGSRGCQEKDLPVSLIPYDRTSGHSVGFKLMS